MSSDSTTQNDERRAPPGTSTTHHRRQAYPGLDRPRPTKVKSPSQIRHDVNQILDIFEKHGHQIHGVLKLATKPNVGALHRPY